MPVFVWSGAESQDSRVAKSLPVSPLVGTHSVGSRPSVKLVTYLSLISFCFLFLFCLFILFWLMYIDSPPYSLFSSSRVTLSQLPPSPSSTINLIVPESLDTYRLGLLPGLPHIL